MLRGKVAEQDTNVWRGAPDAPENAGSMQRVFSRAAIFESHCSSPESQNHPVT